MRFSKVFVQISVLLLIVFFIIKYIDFNNKLKHDISMFKENYSLFSRNYFLSKPINNKDLTLLFQWSKKNLKSDDFFLFEANSLFVKYDSVSEYSKIFYSKNFSRASKNFSYLNYILNRPYAILVDSIKHNVFDCNKFLNSQSIPNYAILQNFYLFNNEESLLNDRKKVKLFYKILNSFEKEYNNSISKTRKLNILWFIYDKGRVESLCDNGLSEEKINNIASNLENSFQQVNPPFFNYSLFAVRLYDDVPN